MKNVFNFDDVIERAKKAFKIKEDKELAEFIGMKANAFYNRKKAQSLPYEELLKAANTQNVSFEWLLTGAGSVHKEAMNDLLMDKQAQKILEIFQSLSEAEKTVVSAALEEKKRIKELEKQVAEMRAVA